MKFLKTTIVIVVSLILMLIPVNPVKANDSGNDGLAGASLFAYGLLFVVDIFSAPLSAKRYNEKLTASIPDIRDKKLATFNKIDFGQPAFSRSALVKQKSRLFSSVPEEKERKERSPALAFGLSVAATALPLLIGIELAQGSRGGSTSQAAATLLITSALTVGPSAGHFYAGQVGRGVLTALGRALFGVLFISSLDFEED